MYSPQYQHIGHPQCQTILATSEQSIKYSGSTYPQKLIPLAYIAWQVSCRPQSQNAKYGFAKQKPKYFAEKQHLYRKFRQIDDQAKLLPAPPWPL